MAVYVDDMCLPADVKNGDKVVSGKWSHLYADSHEELMTFAQRIGLKPQWIQHEGEPGEHFDVVKTKRLAAIRAGAQETTWRHAGEFVAARRREIRERQAQAPDRRSEPVVQPPAEDTSYLMVTGPRDGVSPETVEDALRPHFSPDVVLVAGGAAGVDREAARLWRSWGGRVEEHRVTQAEWDAKPKTAGFDRNDRMVERVAGRGKVLAIELTCDKQRCAGREPHNTHGTSQAIDSALEAGLLVDRYQAPARRPEAPEKPSQPVPVGPEAKAAELDRQAGHAYKAGEFDDAMGLLLQALEILGAEEIEPPQAEFVREHRGRVRQAQERAAGESGEPGLEGRAQLQEAADTYACCRAWGRVIAAGHRCPACTAGRWLASPVTRNRELPPLPALLPDGTRFAPDQVPTAPSPCTSPGKDGEHCGEPARQYPHGWRCDGHRPKTGDLERVDPPDHPEGQRCGCGAELKYGAKKCQGCRLLQKNPPQPGGNYRDLTHGQPGHECHREGRKLIEEREAAR